MKQWWVKVRDTKIKVLLSLLLSTKEEREEMEKLAVALKVLMAFLSYILPFWRGSCYDDDVGWTHGVHLKLAFQALQHLYSTKLQHRNCS
jgi:hypothetical protein